MLRNRWIISRKIVQGAERYGWGLGSQDSPQTENPFSYLNDVCNQVYRVERSIEDSLRDIPHERCLTISYEDFCSNPALLVRSVSEQFLRTPISSEALATLGPLNATNVQKLNDPEFGYITKRIRELSK